MALGAGFMCLTACGFTPLYETSSFSLKIATVPNREGQVLKNELMTLFPYKSHQKTYYLEPVVVFSEDDFGLRRDATTKRHTLTATISFNLFDDDRKMYQDTLTVTTGYNIASSAEIAAASLITSEKDARLRLMHQAAREIKILVESFLKNKE